MRSAAQHRSVSVARSTPTRAQRRDTPKKINKMNFYTHLIENNT
ncbi:MAG: hypothetical protein RML94_15635 [Bacteroidia bacterium]|nr:hypothetical protein [Bacteroidia bacterium]